MIRPDFREIKHSELYHYGIKRRSGRYPYGSGDRPFQGEKTTSSQDISKDTFDIIREIHDSLSKDEKRFLGNMLVSKYTKYVNVINNSYITMDDYGDDYKKEHPYKGLIISIASSSADRGKGISDKLVKQAIKESGNTRLIAEIDQDNHNSQNLFKRNGFLKIDSIDGIDFYAYDKEIKHSESVVNFKMNEQYHLIHGGPGSGRYPLGSGDRPYQKFEGSRRKSGGISGYIRSRKERKAESQHAKAMTDAQKRAAEEVERRRQLEADKERVLRSGSATEIMRYQGLLTNQELQTAVTRLNLESSLKTMSQKEIKSAVDKFNSIMKVVKIGNDWAKIGTDTYNTLAAIYNATPDGQKKPLTLVNKGSGDKKK